MTNPSSALRMLITYAVIIPLAILVGYLLTNPMDYGSLGFFAIIIALLLSPAFIKWYYPFLVFGLCCPAYCFFLVGNPPLWQVVTLLALGIAVVDRAMGNRRFISAPMVTWPLLYIAAMAYLTSRLTGGIGLHQLGGAGGGGKKYLTIFIGIASYFALTSQAVPKEKRNFYIALWLLTGTTSIIGDVASLLGGPFHALNQLFPSSLGQMQDVSLGKTRLGSVAGVFGGICGYLMARYGLRGIFLSPQRWRAVVFLLLFPLSLLGGFRSNLFSFAVVIILMFFMEGLHRTPLLPVALLAALLVAPVVGFFSDSLPYTFQRSMSFLPLKWDPQVLADAQGSTKWREDMWAVLWPQVPDYLLLGKGYSLSAEDFQHIGSGAFSGLGASFDASQETLAISGDYHSGPLTTLIPFGLWGAIGLVWLQAAGLFVFYRNYRYGDPELKTFNAYGLAWGIAGTFGFYFVFGGFHDLVADAAKGLGFSIALNWGICRPAPKPAFTPRIKPLPVAAPAGGELGLKT